MRLFTKLKNGLKRSPLHMPGHKRKNIFNNTLPYDIDITEIDDFDNLYNPSGILKQSLENLTKLYNSHQSFYLVNGSTSGIFVAIKSFCDVGDKIIIARNSHKAVFNFAEILKLDVVFLDCEIDDFGIVKEINLDNLREIVLQNLDAKCVVITSPTYDGVISNVGQIADFLHKNKIPLIVDEAHGSHLFLDNKDAVNLGADVVINSMHKTLPSLTQTAVIHVSKNAINKEILSRKVAKYVSVFCSSSPSYILLCSLDECVSYLQRKGKKDYQKLKQNLDLFKKRILSLRFLKVIGYNENADFYDFDNTKIVISTAKTSISGIKLSKLLRSYNIECEMSSLYSVLCLTSICDDKKTLLDLADALIKIDSKLKIKDNVIINSLPRLNIKKVVYKEIKSCDLSNSFGKVCAEYVYAYPPGIPILVPGSVINNDIINCLSLLKRNHVNLVSTNGLIDKNLVVVGTNYLTKN